MSLLLYYRDQDSLDLKRMETDCYRARLRFIPISAAISEAILTSSFIVHVRFIRCTHSSR